MFPRCFMCVRTSHIYILVFPSLSYPECYLAEGLVHGRKVGRAVLTAPGKTAASKAGVHAVLYHLAKGGDTHWPWETVSAEPGTDWLFNDKQAQCLLLYYFYAYGTCTHLVWWDYCLGLPPKYCKNKSPLESCWFCYMSLWSFKMLEIVFEMKYSIATS